MAGLPMPIPTELMVLARVLAGHKPSSGPEEGHDGRFWRRVHPVTGADVYDDMSDEEVSLLVAALLVGDQMAARFGGGWRS